MLENWNKISKNCTELGKLSKQKFELFIQGRFDESRQIKMTMKEIKKENEILIQKIKKERRK